MKYLTTAEVSALLGLSQRQVQTLIQRGHLRAKRYGRAWLIRQADAEAFTKHPVGRPKKEQ